jgi:hypothetical protein
MSKASIVALLLASTAGSAAAQTPVPAQEQGTEVVVPQVHFIWMGGNDCPPCVEWRRTELPKLQQMPEFRQIQFSYVVKVIRSTVPPAIFLPAEVRPLKARLDEASGGLGGSPQAALVVNGEVYDYFQGTRTADQLRSMIVAARTGAPYPGQRCLKLAARRTCAVAAF